jgi:hypothetical protein
VLMTISRSDLNAARSSCANSSRSCQAAECLLGGKSA